MKSGSPDARLKLTISYDGTGFRGWARQPGERTVEGELRAALGRTYGSYAGLAIAGRTDTGVHALANVASLDAWGGPPPDRAVEALNATLPGDLAIVHVEKAASDFNARYSARARSYRYRVWQPRKRSPFELRRSYWHPRKLDLDRLNRSAALLVGEHDFHAFTPAETQHSIFVRTVHAAEWHARGDAIELEITANSFLRHMVRTLVGTMLVQEPKKIAKLLDGAPRAAAGPTAPPWGLYLVEVAYD
ncbi:MAG TPA: tRNA pseudouridine(38-40) synthase TruA [Gaiellaceae bacterium]|nr:tRNA pseudouridine(38-40) synthase TruA [Gaiellaceae bacterium]